MLITVYYIGSIIHLGNTALDYKSLQAELNIFIFMLSYRPFSKQMFK